MKLLLATICAFALLTGCAAQGTTFSYESQDKKLFIESDSDLAGLTVKRNAVTGELEITVGEVGNSNGALENAAAGIITILPQLLAPAAQ